MNNECWVLIINLKLKERKKKKGKKEIPFYAYFSWNACTHSFRKQKRRRICLSIYTSSNNELREKIEEGKLGSREFSPIFTTALPFSKLLLLLKYMIQKNSISSGMKLWDESCSKCYPLYIMYLCYNYIHTYTHMLLCSLS